MFQTMKRILLGLMSCISVCYAIPNNLHWNQLQVRQYVHSGVYNTDVQRVINKANQYLSQRIHSNTQQKKLAIMLDIDETSLSNFKILETLYNIEGNVGDTISSKQLDLLKHPFHATPILPTMNLYRYALQNKVAVFFVTGRTDNDLEGTIRNLKAVGYTQWKKLILRTPPQYHLSADIYKQNAAKSIKALGYDLVLAVGDQYSDLPKQYADATFKLPNPFYYIQ